MNDLVIILLFLVIENLKTSVHKDMLYFRIDRHAIEVKKLVNI